MSYSIAIDGPAGAGKSTIAKKIAKQLGCIYVDTGAMYRAMALHILRKGISPDDGTAISRACEDADITLRYEKGDQVVLLNGENVNGLIRTEEVGNQREMARTTDLIMDGRDIGTCVLPHADVKVYLTADSKVRAKRRYDELKQKGSECDLYKIEQDIMDRDERDMNREISPLRQAEDAVLLDSSDLTVDEVVEKIIGLVKR